MQPKTFACFVRGIPIIFAKFGIPGTGHAVIREINSLAGVMQVAFLDCGVKPASMAAIAGVLDLGINVTIRDHCDVVGDPSSTNEVVQRACVECLRQLVKDVDISNHAKHPHCHLLVDEGELTSRGTVIVADADADGTLAALKGLDFAAFTIDEASAFEAAMEARPDKKLDPEDRWNEGVEIISEFIRRCTA